MQARNVLLIAILALALRAPTATAQPPIDSAQQVNSAVNATIVEGVTPRSLLPTPKREDALGAVYPLTVPPRAVASSGRIMLDGLWGAAAGGLLGIVAYAKFYDGGGQGFGVGLAGAAAIGALVGGTLGVLAAGKSRSSPSLPRG